MCELTSASSPQPLHKYLVPSPGWMLCRDCGGERDDGENGGGRDGWRKEGWREEGWQERRVGEEWREEEGWWDYGMEGRGGKGMEGGGMRDEGGGMEGRGKSGETMVRERIKWWMYPLFTNVLCMLYCVSFLLVSSCRKYSSPRGFSSRWDRGREERGHDLPSLSSHSYQTLLCSSRLYNSMSFLLGLLTCVSLQ